MERDVLKLFLRAGPSRRFDVSFFSKRVRDATGPGSEPRTYLFDNTFLNEAILFKCVDHSGDRRREAMRPVSTLVYMPYDNDRPAVGGESFFFSVENYVRFCEYKTRSNAAGLDLDLDCSRLKLLDSIPTFSPFMVELAFQRADVPIPLTYLQLTPELRNKLTGHLKGRLRPLIVAAFKRSAGNIAKAVEDLTSKLFCLRDLTDILPLIEALRLPAGRGQDVLASWLGIAYFEYEYALLQPRLKDFANWLAKYSQTIEPVSRADRDYLGSSIGSIRQKIRADWNEIVGISSDYRMSYDDMVFKGKIEPFVRFLKGAEDGYWRMGDVLGRLEQTVSVWQHYTKHFHERRLPASMLFEMLDILRSLHTRDPNNADLAASFRNHRLAATA